MGEVSPADIENDEYYRSGDYIGKLGVESSYERQLRGVKGSEILLRDVRGRIKGRYQNGKFDVQPIPGKNLTLSIDLELQKLGERLMQGKLGSIVAIEPATGEILCMVNAPTYDPRSMVGRQRGKRHKELSADPMKPLLNRSIMGLYPPGSTFKTSQALTFLQEGIIQPTTQYPCSHGFHFRGLKVGCHGHASPLPLVPSIATSCNGYFCWGLYHMMENRSKYRTVQDAMTRWKDYMVSMGFGYKLGVDLPGEKRGLIPNAEFYDKAYNKSWNGLTIISISIGQGEVTLTPLQIANLGATIANRGWFITPHIGRGARLALHPEATHHGFAHSLRDGSHRHAAGRGRRHLSRCLHPRIHRLRQNRHGAEPRPRPLRLHGLCTQGQPENRHRSLRRERWMGRQLRRAPRRTDDGAVYQRKAIARQRAESRNLCKQAYQLW